ncbi:hypothetical protein HDU82_007544 [Entophlyctis luteolus]|nr:hypothetical protein HDU82_007544 [Entophlyctis luteolus]
MKVISIMRLFLVTDGEPDLDGELEPVVELDPRVLIVPKPDPDVNTAFALVVVTLEPALVIDSLPAVPELQVESSWHLPSEQRYGYAVVQQPPLTQIPLSAQ